MNLTKLEGRYRKYGKTSDALAFSAGCWLESVLGGEPGGAEKAESVLAEALGANPVCAPLLLMSAFIHIEIKDFARAGEEIDQALKYRGFFRQSSPLYYGVLMFLQALLESRRDGGFKNVKKARKRIIAAAGGRPELYVASAALYLEASDRKNAFSDLLESYGRGCNSLFFYAALRRFYQDGASPSDPLVYPFLRWALAHGADLRPVSRFADCLKPDFFAEEDSRSLVWKYPHPDLLRKLCLYYMETGDFSAEACRAYKEAEDRQVPIQALPEFLIRAAWKNGVESINRFTMEKYLSSMNTDFAEDAGLTSFVYHLILTGPKLAGFVRETRRMILRFGAHCLENGLQGRYFNSVYQFLAASGAEEGAEKRYVNLARQIVRENMFLYEVRFDNPGSKTARLIVSERERAEPAGYAVSGGVAYVSAADGGFLCQCVSEDGQVLPDEVPKVTALLENPDTGLLWSFFEEGERMFPLLARLGNEIFENEAQGRENPPERAARALTALIKSGGMSAAMSSAANAAMGGIMYDEARFGEALEYYGKADEDYLDGGRIERMLTVFVGAGQWERAARILARKSDRVTDRALFGAARTIAQSPEPGARAVYPVIAGAAYRLLMNDWYDRTLLELVLGHYPGSREEWLELSGTLSAAALYEPALDEMILRNSLLTRRPDEGSQRVFVRTAKNSPDSPLVDEYAYYCVYEMIVNKLRPSYETLLILEKLYDRDSDWLLATGLSHAYLAHGITTLRSDEILRAALAEQEKAGILFPIFQERKDKTGASAYIEKNRAFLYRGIPGKDVRLRYKVDDETEYRSKKMRYARFGIYLCVIPHFYGENITFYFSETRPGGSVSTKEESVKNAGMYIDEESDDPYFAINNAVVYERMFKYDQAEKAIAAILREKKAVSARIMTNNG